MAYQGAWTGEGFYWAVAMPTRERCLVTAPDIRRMTALGEPFEACDADDLDERVRETAEGCRLSDAWVSALRVDPLADTRIGLQQFE